MKTSSILEKRAFISALRRCLRSVALIAFLLVSVSGRVNAAENTRIVSIGGAVTETIFALKAGHLVVGVDTTSGWPNEVTRLPQVGYKRTLSAEGILSLAPSLVIASGDAGPPQALASLADAGVRTVSIPLALSVAAAQGNILRIGELLGANEQATALARILAEEVTSAHSRVSRENRAPRVLFVVNPPGLGFALAAGRNTAADTMIRLAGGTNVIDAFEGYRPLTGEAAVASSPGIILVTRGTLQRTGGVDRFLEVAALRLTPAGRRHRVKEIPNYALDFGPRTGRALRELVDLLYAPLENPEESPS